MSVVIFEGIYYIDAVKFFSRWNFLGYKNNSPIIFAPQNTIPKYSGKVKIKYEKSGKLVTNCCTVGDKWLL